MSDHGIVTVSELLREMKQTQEEILRTDEVRTAKIAAKADRSEVQRVSDELARKTAQLQSAVDSLSRKVGRPGGSAVDNSAEASRAAARGMLELKHLLRVPKFDAGPAYAPSLDDIAEAELAGLAMRKLLKVTSVDVLDSAERKALSSFQLGASGFLLPVEWAAQIFSCLADKTDVVGWFNNINISGSSLKLFADSTELDHASWACEGDCWGAKRLADLAEGLAELEVKPEELRYVVCCTRDVIEDSSVNIEQWLFNKVRRAFQNTISKATMVGDGIGKPQGVLHPSAGVPICDTGAATPSGQFSWQDAIMLKWQIPQQWHAEAAFAMNQNTFALALTMSDAMNRPLMLANPTVAGQYQINGSPVWINTWFPDCLPGATPIAFANWTQLYTVANRRGLTWQPDPFSAGFCILQKFSARIGGGVVCANAGRLLRIR